jgi:hypothetical protein
MIAVFNSVAGFDDSSDTPKNYKDVLKHKNQAGWWELMKQEFHAMETTEVWEIALMSSMPPGRGTHRIIYCNPKVKKCGSQFRSSTNQRYY